MNAIKFWAIGDTHLSTSRQRDLTRFSSAWENHAERLAVAWQAQIAPDDVILLLGDICWTSATSHARLDLAWLAQLPGRKIMIRGNHDRWWVDIQKVRHKLLPPSFQALQGDCTQVNGVLLAGAQGHYAPHDPHYKPDPPHNRYERELKTLQAASLAIQRQRQPNQPLVMMMHYPPYTSDGQPTAYSDLIEAHAPALCLYGHLHRPEEWAIAINNQARNGVYYQLVAADYLQMQPLAIDPFLKGT